MKMQLVLLSNMEEGKLTFAMAKEQEIQNYSQISFLKYQKKYRVKKEDTRFFMYLHKIWIYATIRSNKMNV